jgi:hypothetical protein
VRKDVDEAIKGIRKSLRVPVSLMGGEGYAFDLADIMALLEFAEQERKPK